MNKYINKDYLMRLNKDSNEIIINLSDAIGQIKIIDGVTDELIKKSNGNFVIKPVGYIDENNFTLTGFSLTFNN